MNLFYSNQPYCNNNLPSVFLAGGTPRSKEVASWRPEAIKIFEDFGFTGNLFIPEPDNGEWTHGYENQIDWEHFHLDKADHILFWVPRDNVDFRCMTTNVEFGYWMAKKPKKVFYARPDWAKDCKYMDNLYTKITKTEPFNSLESVIFFINNFQSFL